MRNSSPLFTSPLLIIKKNGEKSLCIDYSAINRATRRVSYLLSLMDDQLDRPQAKGYFTTLNLASSYYCVPGMKESQVKTGSVVPDEHCEFLRMPFGLMNTSAISHCMTKAVLAPLHYSVALGVWDCSEKEDQAFSIWKGKLPECPPLHKFRFTIDTRSRTSVACANTLSQQPHSDSEETEAHDGPLNLANRIANTDISIVAAQRLNFQVKMLYWN